LSFNIGFRYFSHCFTKFLQKSVEQNESTSDRSGKLFFYSNLASVYSKIHLWYLISYLNIYPSSSASNLVYANDCPDDIFLYRYLNFYDRYGNALYNKYPAPTAPAIVAAVIPIFFNNTNNLVVNSYYALSIIPCIDISRSISSIFLLIMRPLLSCVVKDPFFNVVNFNNLFDKI